ncbi:hypothetical protein EVAR_50626_1 [Eumeta japonica]|uniref:Uncharacterized protein n=1 Tax=Eumeta variegata TaxID=151549 RepID=A0A4C1XKJ6_EUMVA|nr:hypothetical protein EVAR_50626_1 [Eumeta japonica]
MHIDSIHKRFIKRLPTHLPTQHTRKPPADGRDSSDYLIRLRSIAARALHRRINSFYSPHRSRIGDSCCINKVEAIVRPRRHISIRRPAGCSPLTGKFRF